MIQRAMLALAALLAAGQSIAQSPDAEVVAERAVPVSGEGRSLVAQRLRSAPPVSPQPESAPVAATDPAPEPAAESRALVLAVTVHGDGVSHLRWSHLGADGGVREFAAWSNVDFRSLGLTASFEAGGIAYEVLPLVTVAEGASGAPDALNGGGDPVFVVVEGDADDTEAILPIAALHQIYREDGSELATAQAARDARLAAEASERALHPDPVRDSVVRFWPIRSNVFPTDSSATAASNNDDQ